MSLARDLLAAAEPDRLALLGFRGADVAAATSAWQAVADDPADLARVGEIAEALRGAIGAWDASRPSPFVPADDQHRRGAGLLPMAALAVTAPDLVGALTARGLPENDAWATAADLGQQVWKHRRVTGDFGLHNHGWLTVIWGGGFAALGRLQYEMRHHDLDRPGEQHLVCSVHIPARGRLTPDDVAASFARARAELPRLFPDQGPVEVFYCDSWLLDPQLPQIVPGSNIAAFSRLWTPFGDRDGDGDALYFGFDIQPTGTVDPAAWVDRLPADTGLHHAIIAWWRAGRHFRTTRGTLTYEEEQ